MDSEDGHVGGWLIVVVGVAAAAVLLVQDVIAPAVEETCNSIATINEADMSGRQCDLPITNP